MRSAVGFVCLLAAAPLGAVSPAPTFPPQLDAHGQAAYRDFQGATPHRAFAVAPGGAYGWAAERDDAPAALAEALARCRADTPQRCVAYAVDDRLVFDAAAWPRLWGPYKNAAEAAAAPVGHGLGERFPDLAFTDGGRRLSVSTLRGKAVILHFWGSWCGPCRREMPDLQRLHQAMGRRADVAVVALQVREPFAVALRWARQQGIRLPLFDSGAHDDRDARFRLADGSQMPDREIAAVFPTTYVLDRHGLVVFSHVGPVSDWPSYAPFLRDVAARSGR